MGQGGEEGQPWRFVSVTCTSCWRWKPIRSTGWLAAHSGMGLGPSCFGVAVQKRKEDGERGNTEIVGCIRE
jgi:hypothetical protein